jgi:CDP-diacylglycerol--glycerol-3-phosphate 3-phosphatidyltransferase
LTFCNNSDCHNPDVLQMPMTTPLLLTLLRIALIPVLVLVFYLPYHWASLASVIVFVSAAITDWLDGYIARKTGQLTSFGAFLDPVADKLMVATALVLLVQQNPQVLFALASAIIIGREIAISALREWMTEMGERGRVSVSGMGKLKTIFQMTSISMLLYEDDIGQIPVAFLGEILLYIAAALTLWSMWVYLHAAWPVMTRPEKEVSGDS